MKSIIILAFLFFSVMSSAKTSEETRQDQQFSVLVNPAGFGPSATVSTGAFLSYYLSPETALEFEYMSSAFALSFYDSYTLRMNSYALTVKQFVANSFYLRAGVGNKTANYSYSNYDIFQSTTSKRGQFSGNSIFGIVAVGNQWSINKFTIGCDWIGFAPVLSSSISETFTSTATADDIDRIKNEEGHDLKDNVAIVTRFYLGMSF